MYIKLNTKNTGLFLNAPLSFYLFTLFTSIYHPNVLPPP